MVRCLDGVGVRGGEEDAFDAGAVLGADLGHEVRDLHSRKKFTKSGNQFVTFEEGKSGIRGSDNGSEWRLRRYREGMSPDCEPLGDEGTLGGGWGGCRGSLGRFSCNPVLTFVSCDSHFW